MLLATQCCCCRVSTPAASPCWFPAVPSVVTATLPRADTQASDRELQQRLIDLLLMHPGGGPAHSGTSTDASKASAQGPSEGPPPVATAGPSCAHPAEREQLLESLLRGALDRRIAHAQAVVAAARGGGHALSMLRRGVALLHLVAALGYDWAVERLLAAGADIDVRVRGLEAACNMCMHALGMLCVHVYAVCSHVCPRAGVVLSVGVLSSSTHMTTTPLVDSLHANRHRSAP